jgi:hypothetical protein
MSSRRLKKPGKIDFVALRHDLNGYRLSDLVTEGYVTPYPFWKWAGATAASVAWTLGLGYLGVKYESGISGFVFGSLSGLGGVPIIFYGKNATAEFVNALKSSIRK